MSSLALAASDTLVLAKRNLLRIPRQPDLLIAYTVQPVMFVLLILLGFAFSWVFALIGLFSSTPETANSIGFTLLFPLTFASSVFVPASTMPDGLRQFAEANPFTTWADALRSLWIGTPAHTDVWMSFVWIGVLIAIFAPLAVARYRRVAAK